jgi:hypothetical protein
LKETVTVPPNSEVILAGQGVNTDSLDTRYCSVEPTVEDERNILVARSLVDPYHKTIPIRLVNLERFPVKIRKNYLLGELHPVIHFENFGNENCPDNKVSSNDLCSDVKSNDIFFGD